MKACRATLLALGVITLLFGCATTDEPLTQKEKDRMAREMERANRKEAQSQAKALRDPTQRRNDPMRIR